MICGTFEVEGCFYLRGRGLVIYGDIKEGVIISGNYISFKFGEQEIKMKIKGVDIMDRRLENIAKIALTFYYENEEQEQKLNSINVPQQTAVISKE